MFAYEIEKGKPVTIIRIITTDGAEFDGAQIDVLQIGGRELFLAFR